MVRLGQALNASTTFLLFSVAVSCMLVEAERSDEGELTKRDDGPGRRTLCAAYTVEDSTPCLGSANRVYVHGMS